MTPAREARLRELQEKQKARDRRVAEKFLRPDEATLNWRVEDDGKLPRRNMVTTSEDRKDIRLLATLERLPCGEWAYTVFHRPYNASGVEPSAVLAEAALLRILRPVVDLVYPDLFNAIDNARTYQKERPNP